MTPGLGRRSRCTAAPGGTNTLSFVVNLIIDAVVGHRVSAKAELEGLDLPEMGQLGYPEFELKGRPVAAQ